MNWVEVKPVPSIFPPTMIPLGFGCGDLLSGDGRNDPLRLLEAALDCGITYFDTARMYGLGGAERILGKLMPRHRERVIIASKAGILPPNRSYLRRLANRGARLLHAVAPMTKGHISAPEIWQHRFGFFKPSELRLSLETSLRELRTDYIDILLMHECTLADVEDGAVLDFLQSTKKQGLIRDFGLATGIEETIRIAEAQPPLGRVRQIPSNIWNMNATRLPSRPHDLVITHSCFGSRFRALLHQLSKDDALAKAWASVIDMDPRDRAAIGQLFLAHALRSNPGGIVLFSSSKSENIRANAMLIKDTPIDASRFGGLEAFFRKNLDRIASN
jgi:D-threo-aldose 1-dehydrogenase